MKMLFNLYEDCEGALENTINAANIPDFHVSQGTMFPNLTPTYPSPNLNTLALHLNTYKLTLSQP